jgi:drug/metabolite transporter (DMT)-like permease
MTPPEPGRTDNIKLTVSAILFTVLALSLGDALIKQVSSDFVLWQIFVVRSACAIPIVIVLATSRASRVSLLPKAIGWTALRSLMLTTMWVAYYAALTAENNLVSRFCRKTITAHSTVFDHRTYLSSTNDE